MNAFPLVVLSGGLLLAGATTDLGGLATVVFVALGVQVALYAWCGAWLSARVPPVACTHCGRPREFCACAEVC